MEKKNNEVLSGVYVAPKAKAFEIKVKRPICDSVNPYGLEDIDGDNVQDQTGIWG